MLSWQFHIVHVMGSILLPPPRHPNTSKVQQHAQMGSISCCRKRREEKATRLSSLSPLSRGEGLVTLGLKILALGRLINSNLHAKILNPYLIMDGWMDFISAGLETMANFNVGEIYM